jgi:hypothetical protein
MTADKRAPEAVAVLDMGASAVRLVIAEVAAGRSVRVVEEASRGVLLGRDTFSGGVIRPKTADATFAALEGFRHIIDTYKVQRIRAVATSAVREARNSGCSSIAFAAGPVSPLTSSTKRRKAGSSILPDMFTEVFGRQLVIRLAGGVA